ncbi:MAG TPA: hypothetical protein VMG41_04665 [Gemmatimonadales bacterium]|nr:hypothetical protein [Gemmatimonadales bacterium]
MRPLLASSALLAAALLLACNESPTAEGASPAPTPPLASMESARSVVFAPDARPYGSSMVQWSERWWQWVLGVPASHNPMLDPTGADCGAGQRGEVWYIADLSTGSGTRSCRAPEGHSFLINLSGVLNDFPCPDTTFHPAPGQSLSDFLTEGARQIVDGVDSLSLTVDGTNVPNLFSYRYTSPLFYYRGSATLQTLIDPCITGRLQPAVSDGYFIMVKPLDRGQHSLTFTAADVQGVHTAVTWSLTIVRSDGR